MKPIRLFTYLFLLIGITTNAQYATTLNFTGTANGKTPYGNVIISGSTMYGMTSAGGANGDGCIFSIGTNGSGYTDLHDFTTMTGAAPHGSLILSGSTLYGLTNSGGSSSDGVIFSIATNGTGYSVLHNFNGTAGSHPMGSLILSGSTLYGTASAGGANSDGCLFSITTSGGSYTDIHDFNATTGKSPEGSLLLSGSTLYGTTMVGGANSDGVIFSVTTSGGSYTDLHDFNNTAGEKPNGSLILSGSTLYGMANGGGANSDGCIFSITTGGSSYTDLYDFTGTYGKTPYSDLLLSNSVFFGLASAGGANSDGVIFSVHTDGTEFTDLYDFNGTNGSAPAGSVTLLSGVLYGMASAGGSSSDGVIFNYTICDASVSASVMSNDVCNGGSTGSISASGSGASSPPFSYSWTGGQTNSTATGLTAGTYTVTATDYYGCSVTASATITQPTALSVTASAKTAAICPGASDSLFSTPSGGTSPYTYAWTPFEFGDMSNSTSQKTQCYPFGTTYTITVTDNCGATATASVNITIRPFPYVSVSGPINPIAPSRSDTLVAMAVGATYLWSNASTTSSIIVSPSVSTTYTVKATNTYGCYDSASYTIDTDQIGTGASSSSPIRIVPSTTLNTASFSTYDSVAWFSFVAADSNDQIIANSAFLGVPVPHVHRLTLYNSSLGMLVDEPMPDIQGANQIRIDISHLTIGNTYYVRAARTPAHANMPGCNPNAAGECNPSQRWSFKLGVRTVHVFVPDDSSAEAAGVNQLYYECRGQIDDINKIPRFDVKAYTNFASPAVYASDSAVSFVYSHANQTRKTIDSIQRVDMVIVQGPASQPYQPVFKMQEDSGAGYLNYFLGFVQNGVPKVEGYSRLVYKNIYSNVDMQVYSNAVGTKLYFIANPASGGVSAGNPASIELKFKGANSVTVTGGGLQVATNLGTLNFAPGFAYTDSAGIVKPKSWQASFVAVNSTTVEFNIGTYNTSEPLVIEVDRGHLSAATSSCLQNLCWSTYFGGTNGADEINGLYTDASGNVYTAGQTNSRDFPVTSGAVQDTALVPLAYGDATITKFNLNTDLLWATYYGGSYLDQANSIVADATQNVYVTGFTYSFADFPRQQPSVSQYPHAYYQQYCNGDPTLSSSDGDAFVIELNAAGSKKEWATWWGGEDGTTQGTTGEYSETGNHIVIDKNKNLYVVGGHTLDIEYAKDPLVTLVGAYNDTVSTGFILKFNVDSTSSNFGKLLWATNIGGNNGSATTLATLNGCAVDNNNNLFVTGMTDHGSYPVGYSRTLRIDEGNKEAVITKFDAVTDSIDWASYYGGDFDDIGQGITISQSGNVYITGGTDSPGSSVKIPVIDPNPGHDFSQPNNNDGPAGSGGFNAFVAELNNTSGGIYWSTYFGGIGDMYGYGIAVDNDSDIYITGSTASGFPAPSAPVANTYTLAFTSAYNGFVAEFNSQLQYGWGTCMGGNGGIYDVSNAINTDNVHNLLYIGGKTGATGTSYPTVQYNSGYIKSFNPEPSPDVTSCISRFNLTPFIPLGIDDISDEPGAIKVYPNPFTGNIHVEMKLSQQENVEFTLYNVMGQMVYDKHLSEQSGMINQEINLSLLAEGIYLLKVDEGNRYYTKKIIKQD